MELLNIENMDTNLSFKFTAVYSVDKANLTCEDMSMKVKIAGINYHLNKNDYSKAPELIFNITIMIDDKEYLCSLGWNFDNNEARVITVHYNKL